MYHNGMARTRLEPIGSEALPTRSPLTNTRASSGSGSDMMDAKGDKSSDRNATLDSVIAQLESVIADLDSACLGRIALPVNEAIELARVTRLLIRSAPSAG